MDVISDNYNEKYAELPEIIITADQMSRPGWETLNRDRG
jgi:hypothetical protein